MKMNSKFKGIIGIFQKKAFSLIELIIAIFILSTILVAMMAVFVSSTRAYQKARAIKFISENVRFALNSIAKDVRMGKIEDYHTLRTESSGSSYLMVTKNRNMEKTCYKIDTANGYLEIAENLGTGVTDCEEVSYTKRIVDLSGTGLIFGSASKFFTCASAINTNSICPSGAPSERKRGWVEINLDIQSSNPSMETDMIQIQTMVSSRDYGWEEIGG